MDNATAISLFMFFAVLIGGAVAMYIEHKQGFK
jgi:hypothetical protein